MIIHITGPAASGKSLLANSLRNQAISEGRGALLVDDTQDGEVRYLLEKIVAGASLGPVPGMGEAIPQPAAAIPWKADPSIILVGDKIGLLGEFEALAPGFTELFGPVRTLSTGVADA
jgi:hypothetical protein